MARQGPMAPIYSAGQDWEVCSNYSPVKLQFYRLCACHFWHYQSRGRRNRQSSQTPDVLTSMLDCQRTRSEPVTDPTVKSPPVCDPPPYPVRWLQSGFHKRRGLYYFLYPLWSNNPSWELCIIWEPKTALLVDCLCNWSKQPQVI